jgi:hypothetical protein
MHLRVKTRCRNLTICLPAHVAQLPSLTNFEFTEGATCHVHNRRSWCAIDATYHEFSAIRAAGGLEIISSDLGLTSLVEQNGLAVVLDLNILMTERTQRPLRVVEGLLQGLFIAECIREQHEDVEEFVGPLWSFSQ